MNQTPPKLQQLLQQMPDVDKVKLLQIAQYYQMDLDDPGFLPLLLTQQGIEALELAKNELTREAGGTVTFALTQARKAFDDSAKSKADDLENLKATALVKIEECAGEAERALKSAVEKWSYNVFSGSVVEALKQTIPIATAAAEKSVVESAEKLAQKTKEAAASAARAAEYVENSAKNISMLWIALILLFGVLIGSVAGYFAAAKIAHSERINAERIAQNILHSCSKK